MAVIQINSYLYDVGDALTIETVQQAQPFAERSRRITRTSTLDGGVVYQDFGTNQGDLDYSVTIQNVTRAQVVRLQELWAFTQLNFYCQDGAYTIRPDSYDVRNGTATIRFYMESRLDA